MLTKPVSCDLPQKSIDYVQDLIGVNIDSRDGFREAITKLDKIKDGATAGLFSRIAAERDSQARELQSLVSCNSEVPKTTGSIAAAAHRTWMDLRAALGGGEQAILAEVERGEGYVRSKYETAIRDLGSCSCVATLQQQASAVNRSHAEICDLHAKCGDSAR